MFVNLVNAENGSIQFLETEYREFKNKIMLQTVLLAMLGGPEIAIIVLALVLLFGGKKIPELMRGLGRGVREFKEGQAGTAKEETNEEK